MELGKTQKFSREQFEKILIDNQGLNMKAKQQEIHIISASKVLEEENIKEPIRVANKFILTDITSIVNNKDQMQIQIKINELEKQSKKQIIRRELSNDLNNENQNHQFKIEASFNEITDKLQSIKSDKINIQPEIKLKNDSIKVQEKEENERVSANSQISQEDSQASQRVNANNQISQNSQASQRVSTNSQISQAGQRVSVNSQRSQSSQANERVSANSQRSQSNKNDRDVRIVESVYCSPIFYDDNLNDKSIGIEIKKTEFIEESNLQATKNSFSSKEVQQNKSPEEALNAKLTSIFYDKKKEPMQELKKSLVIKL